MGLPAATRSMSRIAVSPPMMAAGSAAHHGTPAAARPNPAINPIAQSVRPCHIGRRDLKIAAASRASPRELLSQLRRLVPTRTVRRRCAARARGQTPRPVRCSAIAPHAVRGHRAILGLAARRCSRRAVTRIDFAPHRCCYCCSVQQRVAVAGNTAHRGPCGAARPGDRSRGPGRESPASYRVGSRGGEGRLSSLAVLRSAPQGRQL